jgi:hypothetical protein
LHKPDKEAVATDQDDGQQGEEADDQKQEKTGFLTPYGFLIVSGRHLADSIQALL